MQFSKKMLIATGAIVLSCDIDSDRAAAQEVAGGANREIVDPSVRPVGREPEIPSGSEPANKVSPIGRKTLTGDWNGARTRRAEEGVSLWGGYVSETFAVVAGGLRKGTTYTQQLNVGADFEMERLVGWKGAKIHFVVNDRMGKGLSADFIGNSFSVQETYGFQYAKISELSYDQDISGGRANLRMGLFPIGGQFGQLEGACDFVNVAFCAHPRNFAVGSYWSGYPNPSWGAMGRSDVTPELRLQGGVFLNQPDSIERRYGFNPFGARVNGVIMPFEVEFAPGRNETLSVLPGSYKLGFYYDTSDAPRIGRPGMVSNRYGFYANFSQVVSRSANHKRNLMVIGYFAINPRSGALVTQTYLGGLVKTGTFRRRDRDTLGIAFIRSVVNPNLRDAFVASGTGPVPATAPPVGESVAEIAYGMQVRQWFTVRPSLQWILAPGAFSYTHRPNAMAAGLQVKAQF